MSFEVRKLSDALGAEVIGLDLARPLDESDYRRLYAAWLDNLLLVFRDQHLTPEQHIDFSRRLGPLEIHFARHYLLDGHPEVYVLSNVMEKGQDVGKGSTPYWHSDLSYMQKPAKASMLYGREVPEIGGDTLYANMYMAYEALPSDIRERITGLKAVHNISDFPARYAKMSGEPLKSQASASLASSMPDAVHPLVVRHPETGRLALYVNEGFTVRIQGISQQESDDLLQLLNSHSKQEAFCYRHKWRQYDANLWDNRCTNHSATGGYKAPMRRLMHRTTIGGDLLMAAA